MLLKYQVIHFKTLSFPEDGKANPYFKCQTWGHKNVGVEGILEVLKSNF